MKILDLQDPFYAPLWRRVAITVFCFGWAVFELLGGSPFWGILFGGLGIYCGWEFFFVFSAPATKDADISDEEPE